MVSRSPAVLQYKPSFFEHRQTLQKLASAIERTFDVFVDGLIGVILLDEEDDDDIDEESLRLNAKGVFDMNDEYDNEEGDE